VLAPAGREELHGRIARRFQAMMAQGFLEEVRRLRDRGDLDPGLPALRAVGYRQLWQHLEGRLSLAQAVEQGISASRQLAKRQLTWLRREPGAGWLETGSPTLRDQALRLLQQSGVNV
jgi:tRNA dimethylallyltransferase